MDNVTAPVTGNLLLNRSKAFVSAANDLDKTVDKQIEAIDKKIAEWRDAEMTAIQTLNELINTHQAIPLMKVMNADGTEKETNNPVLIRADVNCRTKLAVTALESEKKAIYEAAHGTPGQQLGQKTVDIASAAGTAIGKAAQTPTAAVKTFWEGLKGQATTKISTTSSKAAKVLGL